MLTWFSSIVSILEKKIFITKFSSETVNIFHIISYTYILRELYVCMDIPYILSTKEILFLFVFQHKNIEGDLKKSVLLVNMNLMFVQYE